MHKPIPPFLIGLFLLVGLFSFVIHGVKVGLFFIHEGARPTFQNVELSELRDAGDGLVRVKGYVLDGITASSTSDTTTDVRTSYVVVSTSPRLDTGSEVIFVELLDEGVPTPGAQIAVSGVVGYFADQPSSEVMATLRSFVPEAQKPIFLMQLEVEPRLGSYLMWFIPLLCVWIAGGVVFVRSLSQIKKHYW